MDQARDRNTVLMPNEIEAIKANQEIIKRMADNSAKTKTVFLALFAAAVTLHKSIHLDCFVLLGFVSVILPCGTQMQGICSLSGNFENTTKPS